jgi:hypothetical protein
MEVGSIVENNFYLNRSGICESIIAEIGTGFVKINCRAYFLPYIIFTSSLFNSKGF